MLVIFCLDDNGGMTFCGKRQSRDRGLIARLYGALNGRTLWCGPYSAPLFENGGVKDDEDYLHQAGENDALFCETELPDLDDPRITELWVFRWNRSYPYDKVITWSNDWRKTEETAFAGSSHEAILWEVWRR